MKIYVEGKLKTRAWEKDGQVRRKTEIVAENIQILYKPEQYRRQENTTETRTQEEQTQQSFTIGAEELGF